MTEFKAEPDAAASIRALLEEIRTIQMVAGQCSVEGRNHAVTSMAAAEAERCRRWADQLDALLASPPPVSPSPDPTAKLQWADVNALVDFALLLGDTDDIENAAIRVRLALAGGLQQLLNEGAPVSPSQPQQEHEKPLRASELSDGVERQDPREVPNEKAPRWQKNGNGDVVCEHGTAMDVHCCGCHSGFLFDSRKCICF